MSDVRVKDRWYVCTGFEQGSRSEGRYYVDNWAVDAAAAGEQPR